MVCCWGSLNAMTYYGYNFLLQFVITPENKNKPPLMKLCKLVTNVLVNLPFFPRADFARLLVCCSGAHNESFDAIGLSVAITSRYKYRMTKLFQCFKRLIWDSSFCSEIFVICWIQSVDPVADLCLTNQNLFSTAKCFWIQKKSLKCKILNVKCFSKMVKRETFKCC